MIFSRKYMFETKKTKLLRKLANIAFVLGLIFISFTTFCLYLPLHGRKMSSEAEGAFYKKAPDLIAIFTGDSGRISYGLEVAKVFPSAKVFISGVHTTNSLQNIVSSQDEYNPRFDLVELDYSAKNTLENVTSTLKYLRENRYLKKILIVSSDYHIYRIERLIDSQLTTQDKFVFYYHGIKTDYSDIKNIKKLFFEIAKMFRGMAIAGGFASTPLKR